MAQKIRIQHYVPRFYLRNFAVKRGGGYAIRCFDKATQRAFEVSIDKVGAEKYFYDSNEDVEQQVEKTLGMYESLFNDAYRKLLKFRNFRLLKKLERKAIVFFVASQEIRTREMREDIRDMIKQIEERLSKERMTEELRKEIQEAGREESIKSLHLKILTNDVPKFADIMGRMKWILLVNRTDKPLWTSDHPVGRYNPVDHGPYGSLGLLSQGINIYFPLSTALSLCLCDPITYRSLPDKVDLTTENNVIFQNHLQVKFSTRHVFSVGDDFSLARNMVKDHPDLGNLKRQRSVVR